MTSNQDKTHSFSFNYDTKYGIKWELNKKTSSINSHGRKLSSNMTSQDKLKLLHDLEEWRKTKRQSLAENVSSKTSQIPQLNKSSFQKNMYKGNKVLKTNENSEDLYKESVFERLYKNEKFKKTDGGRLKSSNFGQKLLLKPSTNVEASSNINDIVIKQNEIENLQNASTKSYFNDCIISNCQDPETQENEKIPKKNFCETINENDENEEGLAGLEGLGLNNNCIEDDKGFLLPINDKVCNIPKENSEIFTFDQESIKNREYCDEYLKNEDMSIKNQECNDESPKNENISIKFVSSDSNVENNSQNNSDTFQQKTTEVKPKNSKRISLSTIFRTKKRIPRSTSLKTLHELNANPKNQQNLNLQALLLVNENSQYKEKSNENKLEFNCQTQKNLSIAPNKLESHINEKSHSDIENELFNSTEPTEKKTAEIDSSTPITKPKSTDNFIMESADKENTPLPVQENEKKNCDYEALLKKLLNLIVELKYPQNKCEEWLTVIRKQCPSCSELPIYWECVAALKAADENEELEHCETTYIEDEVEHSLLTLTQLFDKMLLGTEKHAEVKLEKGINPKNVINSTTIKFVLQERKLKESKSKGSNSKQEKKLVATPVRRSSRIQTPRKDYVVNSLQSLTPDIKKNITFKANECLLD